MRVCWAHGAAQGVWKEMTRRVVAGREEVYEEKSSGVLISLRVDMMHLSGKGDKWEWRVDMGPQVQVLDSMRDFDVHGSNSHVRSEEDHERLSRVKITVDVSRMFFKKRKCRR